MGDGETGKGGEVLDILYPGVWLMDISERGLLGPATQLQPLYGPGVYARRLPNGILTLPWVKNAPPYLSARTSDKDAGRQDLFRIEACHTKAGKTGGAPQYMDF